MVKFSKPGADDPWYNVCVWVATMHVYCMVVVSAYGIFSILRVYACVYTVRMKRLSDKFGIHI